jgi:hypothetical protein
MNDNTATPGMSRRKVLAGFGIATGAAGLAAAGLPGVAGASAPARAAEGRPQAHLAQATELPFGTPTPGLSYLPHDATAFFSGAESGRVLDTAVHLNPSDYIRCSLNLPVGTIIQELNVAYLGSPIAYIYSRSANATVINIEYTTTSLPSQTTVAWRGFKVDTPITIAYDKSYYLAAYVGPPTLPGPPIARLQSMTVGYAAVQSGFVPFTGTTPRILDTRLGGGKVLPGDAGARVIDLGMAGAKAAVINVTADATEGYGYFSVFPDGVPYPGNSSLNWTTAGVTIANTVIAPLSAGGKIKLRAGESAAHAIVDVQGFLF